MSQRIRRLADLPSGTRNWFRSVLLEEGRVPEDFSVSLLRADPLTFPGPTVLMVTVTNARLGISRTYEAIEEVGWIVDFRRDLAAGLFSC